MASDSNNNMPVVLVFAGHDPSGGAGIQADIESLASHGCHAAPVITALTIQDTQDVSGFTAMAPGDVIAQSRAVLEDMPVGMFKIGMPGSVENIEVIHTILADYPEIPVVLDPVLASGQGTTLGDREQVQAMKTLLLPLVTVLTPNSVEARTLASEADTLDACALAMLEYGAEYVLITGTHENTPQVINHLYNGHQRLQSFTWDRLPHSYHGSGCTLAASIAGLMAQGMEPFAAIREAQEFTWNALRRGYRPGLGQYLPDRFYWAHGD